MTWFLNHRIRCIELHLVSMFHLLSCFSFAHGHLLFLWYLVLPSFFCVFAIFTSPFLTAYLVLPRVFLFICGIGSLGGGGGGGGGVFCCLLK